MIGSERHRTAPRPRLTGRRVLLVEDEAVLALDLAGTLEAMGCTVVGPVARLDQAMLVVDAEPLDLAILDISIAGQLVFPVAERLAARAIPFVFLTGYDPTVLPAHLRERPICRKPHALGRLLTALETALAG